jgi:pimeloyl-ACP methyl ester carboxylesterase
MGAYSEQIVFTPSEDRRVQAGVLIRPTQGAVRPIGIVCIHGAPGFFYNPLFVYLGRALAQQGYRFVSGHTRGHDVAAVDVPWSMTVRFLPEEFANVRLGGNGFARWDEEPYDVGGWINFLVAQGAEQIVLFGHSFGVLRVTYYQAERQDPRVTGLVLASGSDYISATDPARLQLAEQLVADGHGEALLPVPEQNALAIESAAYLVHWERHAGRLATDGHTPWISTIGVPVLAAHGTVELNPDLSAQVKDMRDRAVQAPRFDLQVIDGADHNYTRQEDALAEVVLGWLASLPEAKSATRRPWWNRRQRGH